MGHPYGDKEWFLVLGYSIRLRPCLLRQASFKKELCKMKFLFLLPHEVKLRVIR